MYVCMCIYIYIHTYIYTYIYIHTQAVTVPSLARSSFEKWCLVAFLPEARDSRPPLVIHRLSEYPSLA